MKCMMWEMYPFVDNEFEHLEIKLFFLFFQDQMLLL